MSLLVRYSPRTSPCRENEISALTPSSASVALMVTVCNKINISKLTFVVHMRNTCFKPKLPWQFLTICESLVHFLTWLSPPPQIWFVLQEDELFTSICKDSTWSKKILPNLTQWINWLWRLLGSCSYIDVPFSVTYFT